MAGDDENNDDNDGDDDNNYDSDDDGDDDDNHNSDDNDDDRDAAVGLCSDNGDQGRGNAPPRIQNILIQKFVAADFVALREGVTMDTLAYVYFAPHLPFNVSIPRP